MNHALRGDSVEQRQFVATSHPTSADFLKAVCEAVKEGMVAVTATEVAPDGDELATRRLARTRNLNRTFLLEPLSIYFQPVLMLMAQDRITGEWVTMHEGRNPDEIFLVIGVVVTEGE